MPAVSFLPFLHSIPFATRILTLTLVITTLAGIFLTNLIEENTAVGSRIESPHHGLPWRVYLNWLVLVPGTSWKFPWVLVTSGFVELSIVELVMSSVSLLLAARYLERIWGGRELVRFVLVTIFASNVIAFGFSWLTYFVLQDENYSLYGVPYHGMTALQVGFLVAFTQLAPEHQLQLFGQFKVRVKTLPGIYLLISNVLVFLLGPSPYMLVQFGFFVAWVYLRFYKLSEDGLSRGDRSETFAFQYWFPPPVRPYIAKLGNLVFSLATRFKLVPAWDDAQSSSSYAMLPGPGSARAEAERRRALALKALDARLASGPTPAAAAAAGSGGGGATSAPTTSAPSASSTSGPAASTPSIKPDESKVKD